LGKIRIYGLAIAGSAVIALISQGGAVQAQSFNCRYAKTADEVLICQNADLSALDEQMSSLFSRLRNSLSHGETRLLDREQSFWLQNRISCGRDAGCIEGAYQRRIRQLRSY
jgi:uncharacterized protein